MIRKKSGVLSFRTFSLPENALETVWNPSKAENNADRCFVSEPDLLLENKKRSDRKDERKCLTLWNHYYPENRWGWIVVVSSGFIYAITFGLQMSLPLFFSHLSEHEKGKMSVWLAPFSLFISLVSSPISTALCRSKSVRLFGLLGALSSSLGCLYTSFATQFHQLFFSYGLFIGAGASFTRNSAVMMTNQYFNRKWYLMEIIVTSFIGLGVSLMALVVDALVQKLGWRFGLQCVTGISCIMIFLTILFRSAAMYHPQRRAILHLKHLKRKTFKDKKKNSYFVSPGFLRLIRSKKFRIIIMLVVINTYGIYPPLFYIPSNLIVKYSMEERQIIFIYLYLGVSWFVGCLMAGIIVVLRRNTRGISLYYFLIQSSEIICSISIMMAVFINSYYFSFIGVCFYGLFCGSYSYSIKAYVYRQAHSRYFPEAWSLLQCLQSVPILLGPPFSEYMNSLNERNYGFLINILVILSSFLCHAYLRLRQKRLEKCSVCRQNNAAAAVANSRSVDSVISKDDRLSRQQNYAKHEDLLGCSITEYADAVIPGCSSPENFPSEFSSIITYGNSESDIMPKDNGQTKWKKFSFRKEENTSCPKFLLHSSSPPQLIRKNRSATDESIRKGVSNSFPNERLKYLTAMSVIVEASSTASS